MDTSRSPSSSSSRAPDLSGPCFLGSSWCRYAKTESAQFVLEVKGENITESGPGGWLSWPAEVENSSSDCSLSEVGA